MSDGVVWLNGEFTDFASAKVSLEDRGFQFGDGVYEVVRAYNSRPFALAEHLTRLQSSASGIELELPISSEKFIELAHEVLQRSGINNAEIYIQVTRGAARRSHVFPKSIKPTVVVGAREMRAVRPELWTTGCSAITHSDERWAHCNLKTLCLLPNVLAKERANRAGAFEAILVRDDVVTEGTSSNVFLRCGKDLITPIADKRILPGITRAITIKLARERHYDVIERDIKAEELFGAQEIFITGTVVELMPVVKINSRLVGDGRPGIVHYDLYSAFRSLTASSNGAIQRCCHDY